MTRNRGIVRGNGYEFFLQQIPRTCHGALRLIQFSVALLQVGPRHFHAGRRLLHLRGDITAFKARQDFAGLDLTAFTHIEPFQPAGRL